MNTVINLHGAWRYELDEMDQGIEQEWYGRLLTNDGFIVPGTTSSNQIGHLNHIEKQLTKEAVKCLRETYKYLGVVWYQTSFCINNHTDRKMVQLFLERIMFESSVWVDENYVGKQDSLSIPHIYDPTQYITLGKEHILTIRIDNRDIYKLGPYPSAYTDETQTIWNGIVGRAEIIVKEELDVENIIPGVNCQKDIIDINFDIRNDFEEAVGIDLDICVKHNDNILTSHFSHYSISKSETRIHSMVPLADSIILWDEFEPVMYDLEIKIGYKKEGHQNSYIYHKQTGFREISQKGGTININGIQRFLRGNIDCCVYPYTGYPPMDIEEWKDIFTKTKAYGLNHVRFHYWCPPEAAFDAADQLGLYLQIEGPVWMDNWMEYTVGSYEEHYEYLPVEALRMIDIYSVHPSFCIFSNGNELNGDFTLLEHILEKLRARNPYILYTSSTNWDRKVNQQDDIFIAHSVDGTGIRGQYYLDELAAGTMLEFTQGIQKRDIPVISHEVGQYGVYPDVEEIPKFTGVLKPLNLEVIRQDLEKKHLLVHVPEFVNASGSLAWLLYKAEIEAALRTKHFGGIQLLGLHDFPGQSTATVGLLDCFYDSKGLGTEEEFRGFCNDTVVLVKMNKFIYKTSENFIADVNIAHYGKELLKDVEIVVKLEDNYKNTFWSKSFKENEIPIGLYSKDMNINVDIFHELKGKTSFVLKAGILGTDTWNTWNIWVHEELPYDPVTNCYDTLDDEAISKLIKGENVLIFPKLGCIKEIGPSKFFPVFWSPVHFASKDPCGMIIDNKHPLFEKYFPTQSYADFEWKNMLENGFSINIDKLPELRPITMFVPNFFNNQKSTNLFEAKVLNGKMMICCIDFSDEEKYVEMQSMKHAIFEYFESSDFNPDQRIELEDLKKLFKAEELEVNVRKNIALKKPAYSDSIKSASYASQKGNDGSKATCWSAADYNLGHYWQVDLENEYELTGTKVTFNEEANYLYVIHTSTDGEDWELVVNQTGQIKNEKERTDNFTITARYVRITYNGLPSGIPAGHQEFEVYID